MNSKQMLWRLPRKRKRVRDREPRDWPMIFLTGFLWFLIALMGVVVIGSIILGVIAAQGATP